LHDATCFLTITTLEHQGEAAGSMTSCAKHAFDVLVNERQLGSWMVPQLLKMWFVITGVK